jgi:hypothetical protein
MQMTTMMIICMVLFLVYTHMLLCDGCVLNLCLTELEFNRLREYVNFPCKRLGYHGGLIGSQILELCAHLTG